MSARVGHSWVFLLGVSFGCDSHMQAPPQPSDNEAPRAVAGADLAIDVGDSVILDGSDSHDPDGDPLSYRWSMVAGPPENLPRVLGSDARVTVVIAEPGEFAIQLTVTDSEGAADTDEVWIVAPIPNRFPIADAGPDQTVLVGTSVTIDGSGSIDPDGDPLSFSWAITQSPVDPPPILEGADQVVARFVPMFPGTYLLGLGVQDPFAYFSGDEVRIEVVE